jgi:hypothetical protein
MQQKYNRQVLFNHIPKTGGITLRIILNRVYRENYIFLIKSTDIGSSLKKFSLLSKAERERYKVVAGHGAEMLGHFLDDPFRITILREPVSLFLSQYYFLKVSKGTDFYEDVRNIPSIAGYLDYAREKGQDNLLTRFLSNSVQFLADPSQPLPDMQKEGEKLLEQAVKALHEYDAVIDLADFDTGVFELSGKLGWKRIPLYWPSNRNRKNPGVASVPESEINRIKDALRWDISLYEKFKEERIACGNEINRSAITYKIFLIRQKGIAFLSKNPR